MRNFVLTAAVLATLAVTASSADARPFSRRGAMIRHYPSYNAGYLRSYNNYYRPYYGYNNYYRPYYSGYYNPYYGGSYSGYGFGFNPYGYWGSQYRYFRY